MLEAPSVSEGAPALTAWGCDQRQVQRAAAVSAVVVVRRGLSNQTEITDAAQPGSRAASQDDLCGVGLPDGIPKKIYHNNAARILGLAEL